MAPITRLTVTGTYQFLSLGSLRKIGLNLSFVPRGNISYWISVFGGKAGNIAPSPFSPSLLTIGQVKNVGVGLDEMLSGIGMFVSIVIII